MDAVALVIALVCLVLVLVFLVAGRRGVECARGEVSERVEHEAAGSKVILQAPNAVFFGDTAKGVKQIRGNGALILTDREICFFMAVPRRDFAIPLGDVVSVSLTKSHLGKTIFKPLVRVQYHSAGGDESMAWEVQDPETWQGAIEKAQHKAHQEPDLRN